MKRSAIVTFTALITATLLSGCSSEGSPQPGAGASETPEQLIASRCTRCHDRSRIDAASHDAAGWATVVDRMIGKGARLSADERAALIEHLSNR